MIFRLLATALLLTGGWGISGAHAQGLPLCPGSGDLVDPSAQNPDLTIRASAHAEEVRFRSEPNVGVQLTGCSALDTVRVLERRNLPDPVQPGVTYRDVSVAIEILGHLDVTCLLPELAVAPPRAAPDTAPPGSAPVLARLCSAEAWDSIPRRPPGG